MWSQLMMKNSMKLDMQQAHRRRRSAAAPAAASAGPCVQGAVEGVRGSSPVRGARPAGAAASGSRSCHRRNHRLQVARWLDWRLNALYVARNYGRSNSADMEPAL